MAAPGTMSGDFQWHRGGRTPSHNSNHAYYNAPTMNCSYKFSNFTYTSSRTIKFNYSIKIYFPYSGSYFNSPNVFRVAVLWYNADNYVGGEVVLGTTSMPAGTSKSASGTIEIPASHCSSNKITQIDIAVNTKCDCHSTTSWYDWDKCPAWYIGDPRNTGSSNYTPSKPTCISKKKYQRVGNTAHESGDESHINFISGSDQDYGYKIKNNNGVVSSSVSSYKAQKISKSISTVYYYARQRVKDYRFIGNSSYSKFSGWTLYLTYYGVLLSPSNLTYLPNPVLYGTHLSTVSITPNTNNPSTTEYQKLIVDITTPASQSHPNLSISEWNANSSYHITGRYKLASYSDDVRGNPPTPTEDFYYSSSRWKNTKELKSPIANWKLLPQDYLYFSSSSLIHVKLNQPRYTEFIKPLSVEESLSVIKTDNLVSISNPLNPENIENIYSYYDLSQNQVSSNTITTVGDNEKYQCAIHYESTSTPVTQIASDLTYTNNRLEVLYCPCNMKRIGNYEDPTFSINSSQLTSDQVVPPGSPAQITFKSFNKSLHLGNFNYYKIVIYKNNSPIDGLFIAEGDTDFTDDEMTVNFNLPDENQLLPSASDDFQIALKCCYNYDDVTYETPGDGNSHSFTVDEDSNIFKSVSFKMSTKPMTPIIVYPYFHTEPMTPVVQNKTLFNRFKLLFIVNEDENYDNTTVDLKDINGNILDSINLNKTDNSLTDSTYLKLRSKSSRVKEFIKFINKNRSEDDLISYNLSDFGNYKLYGIYIDLSSHGSDPEGYQYVINILSESSTNETASTSITVKSSDSSYTLPSPPLPNEVNISNNLTSLFVKGLDYLRFHCNFITKEDFNMIEDIYSGNISRTKDLFKNLGIPTLGLVYPTNSNDCVKKLYKLLSSIYYRVLTCTSYDKSSVSPTINYSSGSPNSIIDFNIFKYIDSTYRLPGHRFYYIVNKNSVEGLVVSTESLTGSEIFNYPIFRNFTDDDPVYDYFNYLSGKDKSSFNNPGIIYSLDVLTSYSDPDYVDCGLMFESLNGDSPYLVFRDTSNDYFDNFLGYIHGLLTKML